MHPLLAPFAALALQAPAAEPKLWTPPEILEASKADEWSDIAAEDLLVIDLSSGARVVIQLAPEFAPVHVANIRALARADYWNGAKIYRVQENYVVQWGNNESEKPLPAGVVKTPPAEYHRPLAGLTVVPLGSPDAYAPAVGYAKGWPVAYDSKEGTANLTHCYGSVGVGRDLSPDTGMGGELYAVIGHSPRHLDRNIAVVGRVISGMDAFSSLKRGTEGLGMIKNPADHTPIARVQLSASMPAAERPKFQVLKEGSASFAHWLQVKKNRRDAFYIRPAGGVDLCNAPVPVRPTP